MKQAYPILHDRHRADCSRFVSDSSMIQSVRPDAPIRVG